MWQSVESRHLWRINKWLDLKLFSGWNNFHKRLKTSPGPHISWLPRCNLTVHQSESESSLYIQFLCPHLCPDRCPGALDEAFLCMRSRRDPFTWHVNYSGARSRFHGCASRLVPALARWPISCSQPLCLHVGRQPGRKINVSRLNGGIDTARWIRLHECRLWSSYRWMYVTPAGHVSVSEASGLVLMIIMVFSGNNRRTDGRLKAPQVSFLKVSNVWQCNLKMTPVIPA